MASTNLLKTHPVSTDGLDLPIADGAAFNPMATWDALSPQSTVVAPAAAPVWVPLAAPGSEATLAAAPTAPTAHGPAAVAGEILVKFAAGSSEAARADALHQVGGHAAEILSTDDGVVMRVSLGAGHAADQAINALSHLAGVDYAEQNWVVSGAAISNDALVGNEWGMQGDATAPANPYGSQSEEAWAAGATGSMKVVVGDIDSGIDYTHQDLYLNVWLNQGEIPLAFKGNLTDADGDGLITFRDLNSTSNAAYVSDLNGNGYIDGGDLLKDSRWVDGQDQDGNGYMDDLVGWNFVNNTNNPFDDNGHGTHTAGTIGAVGGNGVGVAGVDWNVQILALKFLDSTGSGTVANAAKALSYYTAEAKLMAGEQFVATNNSWAGGGVSSTMQTAINTAAKAGELFVAAAGNAAVNTDTTANYPSNYSTVTAVGYEAVISVAAIDSTGKLASFSNYGANTVDLGAPGVSILSTLPGNSYGYASGTSMATPHVTGAIALYASTHPNASAADIREALLASDISTPALVGKTVTGGRLDDGTMIQYGTLDGSTGSDSIAGTAGMDIISGVPLVGSSLGAGTVDKMVGGAGNDVFVLGDVRGTFYNDGSSRSAGTGDYGLIQDFASGDHIQLSAKAGLYFLSATTQGGVTGTGIYLDTNASKAFDSTDELVGLVANTSGLLSSDFIYA